MTIEQEFFEAFGISKIDGFKCIPHNTIENKCEHIISGFTDCCSNCEHLEKIYPPITPEIVLGLIEILNKEYNILIIECMSNSIKITACPAPEQDWGCDEAYYRVYVEEKDLRTAILKICSDYNVVMSIQEKVRGLFK